MLLILHEKFWHPFTEDISLWTGQHYPWIPNLIFHKNRKKRDQTLHEHASWYGPRKIISHLLADGLDLGNTTHRNPIHQTRFCSELMNVHFIVFYTFSHSISLNVNELQVHRIPFGIWEYNNVVQVSTSAKVREEKKSCNQVVFVLIT